MANGVAAALSLFLAFCATAIALSPMEPLDLKDRSLEDMVQFTCLLIGAIFLPFFTSWSWGRASSYPWQFYVVNGYIACMFLADLWLLAYYPEATEDITEGSAAALARYNNMVSLMIGVTFTVSVTISSIADKKGKAGITAKGPILVFNAIFLGILLTAPTLEGLDDSTCMKFVAYVVKPISLYALSFFLNGLAIEISEVQKK